MNKYRHRRLLAALVLPWLASSVAAAANQPALERLEEQIRAQRAGGTGVGQPAAASPAAAMATTPEPGYLGLLANDDPAGQAGVRVLEVRGGGPAEAAGFKPQDLIVGAGGVTVSTMDEMAAIVATVPPGGAIAFDVKRGSQSLRLEVTLGQRKRALPTPAPPQPAAPQVVVPSPSAVPKAETGPAVTELTAEERISRLEARIAELERRLDMLEQESRSR